MTLAQFGLFYAVGAVVVGGILASYERVNVTFRDRALPYPRLILGIGGGLLWPLMIVLLIIPKGRPDA